MISRVHLSENNSALQSQVTAVLENDQGELAVLLLWKVMKEVLNGKKMINLYAKVTPSGQLWVDL